MRWALGIITAIGVFCALMPACSESTKHRVLSFFLDGVPPPGTAPVRGYAVTTQDIDRGVAPAAGTSSAPEQLRLFAHTPYRENRCGGCHDAQSGQLIKPVGEGLCILCHKDTPGAVRHVHGPVAVNECLLCHHYHAAPHPNLLLTDVADLCFQCHDHASKNFETSIHSRQEEHKGCVQCHGGGKDRHFHFIERITKPTGVMLQRYAHLMASHPAATAEQVTEATHPDPKKIVTQALPTCTECHEPLEDDKGLQKMFGLLDEIAAAERQYLQTGRRLDEVGRGVLLVDKARFAFEDAKTHLIELAPLQHTLDNTLVAGKVGELRTVCDQVNKELDELENGLRRRYRALLPIWVFAICFSCALYVKYKRLRIAHVQPSREG